MFLLPRGYVTNRKVKSGNAQFVRKNGLTYYRDVTDQETALRHELDELHERITRLEAAAELRVSTPTASTVPPPAAPTPPEDQDAFWALNELQSRLHDHPTTVDGVVMTVGSLTLPDGAPVAWQEGLTTADMLETEWTEQAAAFAALGHPVRLELLRHILSGVRATADLAQIESLGTTGQLHHHLRQLVATGWVRQSGRGTYEIPAARVVPLLTSVMSAQR